MNPPVLQSFIAGRWIGQSPAQMLHSAVNGRPVAATHAEAIDFAEALAHARRAVPALLQLDFQQRAARLKALAKYLLERKESLYAVSAHTGATRPDSWIDIEGGIGTLFAYASMGSNELPSGNLWHEGPVVPLGKQGHFAGTHILVPRGGVAVHINAYNFPVWGMLEKFAPTFLAGMPCIGKPATATSYLTEALVRLIADSGVLPEGSLQLVIGGTGDLLDDLIASMPKVEESGEDDSVKIAIVGKPNAGKSSLLNRLVGEERAIVSPIAGTTRDAIDTPIEYQGIPIVLIDTAGIRRRGRIEPGVEKYSVLRTLRAIERCDVALLMIDATAGVTAQDAHIAGYILDANKSVVVLVNKWDAVTKDSQTMQEYTQRIRQELNFMDYVPILFISAKTGQRVDQVLPLALKVQEERLAHLPTAHLNRILQAAQDAHTPTSRTGKSLRIYYGTQVRTDPPTFLIYVNDPKLAHFTYLRYLENCIRREYPFTGTPIRLVLKPRR
jgi:small GTP-binding protein